MASTAGEILRWERFGGQWRILEQDEDQVTVGLFTCDGGAEMSRLTAPRIEVDDLVAIRRSAGAQDPGESETPRAAR